MTNSHVKKVKVQLLTRLFLGGSSSCDLITHRRINRKPGLSKTLINQRLIRVFNKRVIFRVITPKVT